MKVFLGFVLYAPMAAFGAVAVGERRPGWDRPARSALTGLLGAALGLDRADEASQLALAAGYGMAVRTDARGTPLVDYHTAQVPPSRRGRRYTTRAAELADKPLETVLTRREYRADALHTVVIWPRAEAVYTLDQLLHALERPAYSLMFGRKSCPLGLPLAPRLIEAADPLAALAVRVADAPAPERAVRAQIGRLAPRDFSPTVALDAADIPDGRHALRIEQRRDVVASRARWQFSLRAEAVLPP